MNSLVKIVWIFSTIVISGCASVSSSPKACEESLPLVYPFVQKAAGTVFQIGDCSISKKLRIETGSFFAKK